MQTNTNLALRPERAWTGSRMIDVLNPDPEDIILRDITVGLSREPRYGGAATLIPWTVGQHTLFMDDTAETDGVTSREIRLMILLHDAPEYMMRDMIAPMKRHLPEYKALEKVWWRAVAQKFGLPETLPGVVKFYDMTAAASEKAQLIAPEAGEWPNLPMPRRITARQMAATPLEVEAELRRRIESLLL
jgi:hypothetical protein